MLIGWQNPLSSGQWDLQDGEFYWDTLQKAVLCRMAEEWYVVSQPQRILEDPTSGTTWAPGDPNTMVYTGNALGSTTLSLETDPTKVALGNVVRVAWQRTGIVSGNITISYGGASPVVISANQAAEFVFCKDDSGNKKWFVTQANVATRY